MSSPQDNIQRRNFLGTLLAASASLGIAGLSVPSVLRAAQEKNPPPSGNTEFEAWLGKIKGKHRQLFDATAVNNGMPLVFGRVFQMSNEMVGVPASEVSTVVVLRHDAIPIAMESGLWEKYKFGEVFKVADEKTKTPLVANPFWHPKEGTLPVPGMALDELLKSGVLIGVCNMALTVFSGMVAGKMKMDAAEVKKEWVAGIFPGIQIVPAGVLAVNRAQEHGCTYCFAG